MENEYGVLRELPVIQSIQSSCIGHIYRSADVATFVFERVTTVKDDIVCDRGKITLQQPRKL